MRWLDRLLGRQPHKEEREADQKALGELHDSFDKVRVRTDRLESELRRVNAELRRKQGNT